MRRFYLDRQEDATGVSGTGKVAEGVVFTNGWVALTWLTQHTSVVFYPSITDVEFVHGHGGKTKIVFLDADKRVMPKEDRIPGMCPRLLNDGYRRKKPVEQDEGRLCIDHQILDWNW
jgi:hypothetical protein